MEVLNSIVEFVLKLDMMGVFVLSVCIILVVIFIWDAIEGYKEVRDLKSFEEFKRRCNKK